MWIVIVTETHYTPGDQRSRDCPGHGYPESWDKVKVPYLFTDEVELTKKLGQLDKQNATFTVYEANQLKVTKKTSFDLLKQ